MTYWNLIPWSISALSLLIVILTFFRAGDKQKKEDINEENSKFEGIKEGLIKANMKLDQVCATTNETRTDIKSLNLSLTEIDKRVCILESEMVDTKRKIGELENEKRDNH